MFTERPYCLSIAGCDPSGGAGLMADIKTFEGLEVYGLGVVSAVTYQNDSTFIGLNWLSEIEIEKQLIPLKKYPVKYVKIGLVKNVSAFIQTVTIVKELFKDVFIIWDPIIKATAGFKFHENLKNIKQLTPLVDLITPNYNEFSALNLDENNLLCSVLLKGGHRLDKKGTDILYHEKQKFEIKGAKFEDHIQKHGTGCVLSSAIAANLALNNSMEEACIKAKKYTEKIMLSNPSNLGYHYATNH